MITTKVQYILKEIIKPVIKTGEVSRPLIYTNFLVSIIYLSWWFYPGHMGNPLIYSFLLFGEIYHIFMAWTFWFTVFPVRKNYQIEENLLLNFSSSVDIFITVAGEPVDVVRPTAIAAKNLNYPNHQVYLLNDGFVAKKDNWEEIEKLALVQKIRCI